MLPPFLSWHVESSHDLLRALAATGVTVLLIAVVGHFRRVEQRFATIVELAAEGIWAVNAVGRTTFVNDRLSEMLGYTRAEMLDQRFSVFLSPEDLETAEAGFDGLLRGVTERGEGRLRRKDGSLIWTQWAATPTSEGARFTGAFALITDVTEIRARGEALRRADQQKQRFLAMLSHEMRNPLAAVVGALKVIEIKGHDPFARERQIIARQIGHMQRMVGDLFDVSRFGNATGTLRRERVRLAEVVNEAVEQAGADLTKKAHQLTLTVDPALTVMGDKDRLVQVVSNLLSNAARYTPRGGRISLTSGCDAGDICLHVRDTGVGIAPEFLAEVFEPFTRDVAATADHAGLGLGLAIVRGIVKSHGGTVAVRSDGPGLGAEFIVRLPVADSLT